MYLIGVIAGVWCRLVDATCYDQGCAIPGTGNYR